MTLTVSASPGRLAFSVSEAAEQLGLGERTVWRLIETGALAPVVKVGRRTIVPATTIAAFLERNQYVAPVA